MTLHTKLSYLKSFVRMVGFLSLVKSIELGAVILVAAEAIGIIEELPGTYKGTQCES